MQARIVHIPGACCRFDFFFKMNHYLSSNYGNGNCLVEIKRKARFATWSTLTTWSTRIAKRTDFPELFYGFDRDDFTCLCDHLERKDDDWTTQT